MSQIKERPNVVIIAGPTASGKSSLAVELALVLGGEIISSDSMQVFRGMDVGTAKPTLEQQKNIPHHLIDAVDPDQEFNAATFRSLALPLIGEICSRGKICLVVGGTGLYIKSLLGGLLRSPPADTRLRESLRLECENHGSERLYERLRLLDPEWASRIHPNDKVRIIRSLEIISRTNRRHSELSREHSFRDKALRALKLCLQVDREELYQRINQRSAEMVRNGLVEEVKNLLEKGYSSDLKPMKSIGYRHIIKYLEGAWSLSEATLNLQRDTRRYAKRQLTWFRADPEFSWISPNDIEIASLKIREFLVGGCLT
ncbi:MAG: tRNA (adenosine(37)-N6)-dimethylallyltransferase MiaA [Pseudomonadota bacterium]